MSTAAGSSTTPQKGVYTPQKRAVINADAGPSRARPQGASPAYSSRRHSLYGIEDRVVIDPGSRVWKVGFSGEADPRAVFWSNNRSHAESIWELDLDQMGVIEREEASRLVGVRITTGLRESFSKHLMTDSKSRKVIVLENTYLPAFVKEHIAQALFDNLKVPSISFTSSALLALNACGRITGLVVDCGWLETTVTPVYYSRPLFQLSRSTPLAGRALHRRLKALLRRFATYYPPPVSLSNLKRDAIRPVPERILTDEIVERVLTETCFVGDLTVAPAPGIDEPMDGHLEDDEKAMDQLAETYAVSSTATDLSFPIPAPGDMGPGTMVIPGWIRERAAEVLFTDDVTTESCSVTELLLQTLFKLPIDLKSSMASTILLTGGTASLPGFIPRLRISLKSALLPPPSLSASNVSPPINTPAHRIEETREWRRKGENPYKEIYGLMDKIAILNDPAPLDGGGPDGGTTGSNAGTAPRWVPSLLSWVGGSIAGMIKTGAPELLREEYDTAFSENIVRGEAFMAEQEAKSAGIASAAAALGIELDSLRPGEALGLGGRRRGWKEGVRVHDWSAGVKT